MESIFPIIEALAHAYGFPLIRVTSAMLNPQAFSHYDEWIKAGKMGEMTYMARDPLRRKSVKEILPEAKSVICLGVPYGREWSLCRPEALEGHIHDEARGRRWDTKCMKERTLHVKNACSVPVGKISRYAYGRDYHKIIEKMLKNLTQMLTVEFPGAVFKSYVDTGAILERAYAAQARMGFIGKNTMLITREFGSWVFLAEILTTLEIPREKTETGQDGNSDHKPCGYCHLCHDICPTGALSEKGIDARRCISYLTIEHRGSIPIELRPLIGNRLFGCDACQEICPHNSHGANPKGERNALEGRLNTCQLLNIHPATENGISLVSPCDTAILLEKILNIRTKEEFNQRFQGSAVRRAKLEGLVRNACVVAGNIKAKSLLPLLEKVAQEDASEIVREHAEWAADEIRNFIDKIVLPKL